jgi:hypothetical protein
MSNTMRVIFIVILFTLLECSSNNLAPASEKQWVKVEISNEHAPVYSIYGDINQSLFVTLYGKILNTTDKGLTWTTKLNTSADFGAMEMKGDTLFAISNFEDYYSLNAGESWLLLSRDVPLAPPAMLHSSTGIIYQVKENSNGELALPSDLQASADNGRTWTTIFPYQHGIYSLSIDQSNVLYVGVNNTVVWNQSKGTFEENLENNAAFYYSKN